MFGSDPCEHAHHDERAPRERVDERLPVQIGSWIVRARRLGPIPHPCHHPYEPTFSQAVVHAAVVTSFDALSRYLERPDPQARGRTRSSTSWRPGLHPRVRSRRTVRITPARTSPPGPPRPRHRRCRARPQGPSPVHRSGRHGPGSVAERTVIDVDRSVLLPRGIDRVRLAAMNPAMSSWVALRRRIEFRRGQRVLILGATRSAGRMAIQAVRRRTCDRRRTRQGPPRRTAPPRRQRDLCLRRARRGEHVDVVIDYVWGEPAARAMVDILTARADAARRSPTFSSAPSPAGPRRSPPPHRNRPRLRPAPHPLQAHLREELGHSEAAAG